MTPPAFRPDSRFLPMTRAEMEARGWDHVDIVFVTGDAYIDHYSFAMSLLGEQEGAHEVGENSPLPAAAAFMGSG